MRANNIMLISAAMAILFSCGIKKEDPSEVAAKLLKDKGIEVPFHPSVNFPELIRQYKANPDLWDAAFDCLASNAPKIHELTDFGTTELVGRDCFVTIDKLDPKPFGETKLEGHRKYLDIQLTEGPVRWGICGIDSGKLEVLEDYDEGKDIAFYLSEDTAYYDQAADDPHIFVFFPSDLHNPSFAAEGVEYERSLSKIVIKIAYSE